jgi:hypothetical protein
VADIGAVAEGVTLTSTVGDPIVEDVDTELVYDADIDMVIDDERLTESVTVGVHERVTLRDVDASTVSVNVTEGDHVGDPDMVTEVESLASGELVTDWLDVEDGDRVTELLMDTSSVIDAVWDNDKVLDDDADEEVEGEAVTSIDDVRDKVELRD